jgi:hypothetical protein
MSYDLELPEKQPTFSRMPRLRRNEHLSKVGGFVGGGRGDMYGIGYGGS